VGEESSMGKIQRTVWQPIIVPEGGGGTIPDRDSGDGSVGSELIIDDFPQIAVCSGG